MALTENLAPHIPYLRRYARAVTGSQTNGDAHVRATLTALLSGKAELAAYLSQRVALYRLFHTIWAGSPAPISDSAATDQIAPPPQVLAASRRPALLLTLLEGFSVTEAGHILQQDPEDVEHAIAEAQSDIEKELTSRVLIIEDEALIALDLENVVQELGHEVVGKAVSKAEALEMARTERPGLILADINLGQGGSGLEAAVEILRSSTVPVIFVTAYPECLLTGERPEPTFLVTKPFLPATLQATISQALFFHRLRSPAPVEAVSERPRPVYEAPSAEPIAATA